MKVVTKDEMEQIDSETINRFKVPSIILMENAGIAIAQKILELYPKTNKQSIAIMVGPGNNGGDGLVIARYFFRISIPLRVYIFGNREKFKGDPLINLDICENLSIPITDISSLEDWEDNKNEIFLSSHLIDSLFGTGLTGEVRDFYKQVISDLNQNHFKKVIAVDVPSGLLNIVDRQNKIIIKADDTITVALPKIGTVDYPGKTYVGTQHIVQIGFPDSLLTHKRIQSHLITQDRVKSIYPKRPSHSHKGTFGNVLVIGGSRYYSGAAILSSKAALKSGCGLVTLASIPQVCQSLRMQFPEGITIDLEESKDGYISSKSIPVINSILSKYKTIVFGPGIGRDEDLLKLLSSLLENYEGTILIDADGLFLLSTDLELLNTTKAQVILTPHIKEMGVLVKKSNEEVISNKISIAKSFVNHYNCTLVLKSAVTLVSALGGNIFFNSVGNEGLATAGTGDVLVGIIAGFCAQGMTPLDSSLLGIFLHGLTGDIIKNSFSSETLIASDIISHLHLAIRRFSS